MRIFWTFLCSIIGLREFWCKEFLLAHSFLNFGIILRRSTSAAIVQKPTLLFTSRVTTFQSHCIHSVSSKGHLTNRPRAAT